MLGNIGLLSILLGLLLWLLPLAAFVWALVTLARLRRGQDELLARLATLEAALGARHGP